MNRINCLILLLLIQHTMLCQAAFSYKGLIRAEFNEVPVLCYHNIQHQFAKEDALRITSGHFNDQMKMLHDSGYHTILPEDLYNYYTKGGLLPSKPILLSFDDSRQEHCTIVAPILQQYGFRGVFFVMTVCIEKNHYLSREQIRGLSDAGHVIACHTWDHPDVTKIHQDQWTEQLDKPIKTLEAVTGKPVEYFAYPNGIWSEEAINVLKQHRIKAAFQLMGNESLHNPVFTIRRVMVSGKWTPAVLYSLIKKTFKNG